MRERFDANFASIRLCDLFATFTIRLRDYTFARTFIKMDCGKILKTNVQLW